MARKIKTTKRQHQANKIAGSKAKKKRMKTFRRRAFIPFMSLLVVSALFTMWHVYNANLIGRFWEDTKHSFYAKTVEMGFDIEEISISGRNKTNEKDLLKALGVGIGDSIVELSLDDALHNIEKLSTVRSATIERFLPNNVHISLVERKPIAVWQYKKKLHVVDIDGVVLKGENPRKYRKLMVVVGKDAPKHIAELFALMEKENELSKYVVSAQYIGGRRWNMYFPDGIRVLLPEDKTEEAWHHLAEMQKEQQILQKSISAIDMRLYKRIFIKLVPVKDNKVSFPIDDRQADT